MNESAANSLPTSAPAAIDLSKLHIKGIIFDYGGTIDSHGDHWSEVIWDAYCQAGVPVDKATFREAYVAIERELARVRHILPHHTFRDLMEIKMHLELQWLADVGHIAPEQVEPLAAVTARLCYEAARASVEDARPVLEALAARFPMVLVSNFYGNVEAVLLDFDLRRYFGHIVESAVVGVRKPDPAIFALGVDALGLTPEEVLVVGDSYRKDILPARSLGCHTAWLKGKGWTPEEDAQTDPAQIPSLASLLALS
ncbi:MAG: HAD family hydrolase [Candidatus Amulumruptor caecigallinarius]|nr:HAD family hydrolase [Candidatus Amulumruptor caecigallinarius]MCM1397257.1 HAD family hydrolase [Candidatus Amulumruptor caecigallinarius]MCM1454896.1 HAD family hydrolase [bacterium]